LAGGQELLRPAGQQLEQQLVDAVEQVGAGVPEAVTAAAMTAWACVAVSLFWSLVVRWANRAA